MRMRPVSMLAGALLLAALPVQAHHSFAAEFDEKQPVTLRGTLTKMEWFNPHGWIYIDVKEPDGKVTNWGIEAGSPTTLLRRGLRKTDFSDGRGGGRRGLQVEERRTARERQDVDLRRRSQFLPRCVRYPCQRRQVGSSRRGRPSRRGGP